MEEKVSMKSLYIDAGWTSIGYCVFDDGVRGNYSEFHFSQKDKVSRLSAIKKSLQKLIVTEDPDRIVCEDFVVHGAPGVRAQNVLCMIGLLVGLAEDLNVKISLCNFGHWKAQWKKIENKPNLDGMKDHEKDAIMMGYVHEGFFLLEEAL